MKAVEIRDLWARLGDEVVLQGIDLEVDEKSILAIIGPNGGGKTTLLRAILGIVKPGRGSVLVFGEKPEKARTRTGYVPQFSLLDRRFPATVYEVIKMGTYGKKDTEKNVEKALDVMEIEELRNRRIGELSGGQLQRTLIARALVREPELLLLDEPTASIDYEAKTSFYELLPELKEKMAIIIVTHDVGALSEHVEKVACLNRKLYYHGAREGALESVSALYHCPVDILAHGVPHRVLKEHR